VPIGRHASKRISKVVHCYTVNSSVKKSSDDDADTLAPFMPPVLFYNIFRFCYVLYVIHKLLRIIIGVLFNPNR
jgi:hypothetical protein